MRKLFSGKEEPNFYLTPWAPEVQHTNIHLYAQSAMPLNMREQIQQQLVKKRPRELIFGNTMLGPHRDDLHITYKKKEAKTFASEGQKRTCIAALKMAEWAF